MEAPHLKRKLVAILAADIEGFSRHMEHNEAATLEVLSAHRVIIDGSIGSHGGRITGTAGDSVVAEFGSVLAAVECAIEIQHRLSQENAKLDPELALMLRIGINVGDVMVKEGDIFGDGVNIAARLESLAEPGGVCVSRGVRDHLRKHRTVVFEDLGEQKVKNIAHPIRAFKIRLGETPQDEGAISKNDTDLDPSLPDPPEVELAFWHSIQESQNPEEFELYMQRYPEGAFAALADTRRQALLAVAQNSQASSGEEDGVADEEDSVALELAFWEAVKDTENETELEAYLGRYPEGEFVPLAKARLAALREGRDDDPVEVELTFWASVKDSTDLEMFRAYLARYPNGRFSELARIKIASRTSKQ